ncbi:Sodium bicarbonate cotransporter 3 [Eumeta japonica]|uniref:Sodium bicarbonate cotransporter 3 n=1 Tax=Eumeta variegata TaxID=151549 RepID=A0A4C2AGK1_EUMVA|nr:Sodium bicarbonate cotransporter 3 [Eumeta japonica]
MYLEADATHSEDASITTIKLPHLLNVYNSFWEKMSMTVHVSHPLFSEYLTLVKEGDEIEWKETARWIKFEEDVEEGGNRWSKPHVATLSLHSLFELRSLLLNGSVILDMEANNLDLITDLVCEHMINARTLLPDLRDKVKDALLRRHRHQHEYNKKLNCQSLRSLAEIGCNQSSSKRLDSSSQLQYASSRDQRGCYLAVPQANYAIPIVVTKYASCQATSLRQMFKFLESLALEDMIKSPSSISFQRNSSSTDLSDHRSNMNFMRKIPPGAEASNILVGEVDFLDKPLAGFIRLRSFRYGRSN